MIFMIPITQEKQSILQKRLPKLEKEIYSDLTNWQRLQLSRHLNRPHTLDYIHNLFTDFVELHGDRKFKDDSGHRCRICPF